MVEEYPQLGTDGLIAFAIIPITPTWGVADLNIGLLALDGSIVCHANGGTGVTAAPVIKSVLQISGHAWKVVDELKGDYHVIAPDWRGFGLSQGSPSERTVLADASAFDSTWTSAIARFIPLAPVGGTICAASPAR